MQEAFLHYLWKLQYFDKTELATHGGQPLQVMAPGFANQHAGPDFQEARLRVEEVNWCGAVEIHLHSSDWLKHHHHTDPAYDNVILHVVWQHDREITRTDGTAVPVLELKNRVADELLMRYKFLCTRQLSEPRPCSGTLQNVPSIIKTGMLERCLAERLHRKASDILHKLQANTGNWEETGSQVLLGSFGFKVNAAGFEALGQRLPLRILQKHADQPLQVEALLFGMGGFLNGTFKDGYPLALQKEFRFLKKKYFGDVEPVNPALWKMLRMRPANFPAVRLAQFSAFFLAFPRFFSLFIELNKPAALLKMLQVKVGAYWQSHYAPDRETGSAQLCMGKQSAENIIINTVAPLKMAYGIYHDMPRLEEQAIELLAQMPAEQNTVIRSWKKEGVAFKTAAAAQGGLELQRQYCENHRCLSCQIGHNLLKTLPVINSEADTANKIAPQVKKSVILPGR